MLAVKEFGGTGRVHDWANSGVIVEAVNLPVCLAGGLNAGDVAEAVARVRPFGPDLYSGVRSDGPLDDIKLRGFFAALGRD